MIDEQLLPFPPNKPLPQLEPPQNKRIRIKKRQLLLFPPNVDEQPQPQLDKSPMLILQISFTLHNTQYSMTMFQEKIVELTKVYVDSKIMVSIVIFKYLF